MSTLFVRGIPYVGYVFDTAGTFLNAYDVPPGSTEGSTSKLLRTQVAAPDGTVWLGISEATGGGSVNQINPITGAILGGAGIATAEDFVPGYTLTLLPGRQALGAIKIAGARTLVRFGLDDGLLIQTYSLPADTVTTFALAHDGTTLYYVPTGTTQILRWDLNTNTALAAFGDLGTNFVGQFVLTADDHVLGAYTAGSGPKAKLLNYDASVARTYAPTSMLTSGNTTGVAYELSTDRVYVSCAGAGIAGVVTAFHANDGVTPIWTTEQPFYNGTPFGYVVVTPPNGPPQPYPTDGLTQLEPIYRLRVGPILTQEQARMFVRRIQLVMSTGGVPADGVAATVAIQHTWDYGATWSNLEWQSAGALGDYVFRVQRFQEGSGRNLAYRVMMTSTTPVALLQMLIDVEAGIH